MIPFNKPSIIGNELSYIAQAVASGRTSGNGPFTTRCQRFFETAYGYAKCLLTTSGTDALEMAAILSEIRPGDEVIMPSYTFVSTALAFVRQGATIVFADSAPDNPNVDADHLEKLITPRTKVLVPVHYAGVACEMDKIMALADKYDLLVVADAAHAVASFYKGPLTSAKFPWHRRLKTKYGRYPLGGIGHLGCFSFHETKNIQCGEGGMLAINDPRLIRRAEIIWEKGTNRADYFRGKVAKYEWVDVGSSFLPSGITAAFLWAQLEAMRTIQERRVALWKRYESGLRPLALTGGLCLPQIPAFATNNAHMFYVVCASRAEREHLQNHLAKQGIQTASHYQTLHDSAYYREKYHGLELVNCKRFVDCLLRLPMFYELKDEQVDSVVSAIRRYYCVSIDDPIGAGAKRAERL